MSYLQGYIAGDDFGRVCDVCGRLRPGKTFRVVSNIWICSFHPSYIPRQPLDKVPFMQIGAPRSIPNAKPLALKDTFEVAEGQILNMILSADAGKTTANVTACDGPVNIAGTNIPIDSGQDALTTGNERAAGWSLIYLHDLIVEAKRPLLWIRKATALVKVLADYLVARQIDGPGSTRALASTTNASSIKWGGYGGRVGGSAFTCLTEYSAVGGLALLRAYQLLGTPMYLSAARACAWFIRGAQCGDKLIEYPSSSDSAGTSPIHHGAWARSALNAVFPEHHTLDHFYDPRDLIGLEFLRAFKDEVGDETIGSSAITAVFGSSRAAPISTCIAEAMAFWTDGAFSVDDGAVINGLSSTTPRNEFSSYPTVQGNSGNFGLGSWNWLEGSYHYGLTIASLPWAQAIRGIRAIEGDSARVIALFDYLMSFTSASAYELPTRSLTFGEVSQVQTNDQGIYSGTLGAYDPKVAPATVLTVVDPDSAPWTTPTPVAVNGSSFYDLAALGMLAPLYASRQQAAFAATKDSLNLPRPRFREGTDRDNKNIYLGILGTCGLSMQPFTTVGVRIASVAAAAQLGNIYRYAPQAFGGRGV